MAIEGPFERNCQLGSGTEFDSRSREVRHVQHAVTIVARNYLPQARVLAASFLAAHPTTGFSTLVVDGTDADRLHTDVGEVVLIDDLGLDRTEWHPMAAMYTVMEFATALKPALLRWILSGRPSVEAVAYIDPDVHVRQEFDDVFSHAVTSGIALTPHVLHPMPRDGHMPSETTIMQAGIFNLGFICVGRSGLPMLDWWHERMRTDAVVDFDNGLFTDQRWIDWVPALFGAHIERDPGLNVAYWNLHERPLTIDGRGEFRAADALLRFFHFSGFDPTEPWRLSKYDGNDPRVVLSNDFVLSSLCAEYAELLETAGFGRRVEPYGFDSASDGSPLRPSTRHAYRRDWMAAAAGIGSAPPDPFDDAQRDEWSEWITSSTNGPLDSTEAHRDRDGIDADPPSSAAAEIQRELDALRRTKTFRWSAPARTLYGRLRARRARSTS